MTKGLHKGSLRKADNPHQWMIDDARMELIQQIKAEVERLKVDYLNRSYTFVPKAMQDLLDFISDLEKEEKQTTQEQPVKTNIVEDLKHYLATTPKEQIEKDWESLKEWGKVGPSVSEFLGWEQPVCEDVEKELERFLVEDVDACVEDDTDKVRIFDVDTGKGDIDITYTDLKAIARHFAQWGAEHLDK